MGKTNITVAFNDLRALSSLGLNGIHADYDRQNRIVRSATSGHGVDAISLLLIIMYFEVCLMRIPVDSLLKKLKSV